MSEPRAYTADETRDMLLEYIWTMVRYWGTGEGSYVDLDKPINDRLSGVAFSILAMLDGTTDHLPGFRLVPTPHPDDEQYHRDEGENWFDPANAVEDMLHEHFYRDDLRRDVERKRS